jgi:hypothetical protein
MIKYNFFFCFRFVQRGDDDENSLNPLAGETVRGQKMRGLVPVSTVFIGLVNPAWIGAPPVWGRSILASCA